MCGGSEHPRSITDWHTRRKSICCEQETVQTCVLCYGEEFQKLTRKDGCTGLWKNKGCAMPIFKSKYPLHWVLVLRLGGFRSGFTGENRLNKK